MKVLKRSRKAGWTAFNNVDENTLKTISHVIVCKNAGMMGSYAKDFADFYSLPFHDLTTDNDAVQNLSVGALVLYYGNENPHIPITLHEVKEVIENRDEYRAYWPKRIPQLGMCPVISMDWINNEVHISTIGGSFMVDRDELILVRYTGFMDKTGRKIFFNDFLYDDKLRKKFLMVEYLEMEFMDINDFSETFNMRNLGKNLANIEILGNLNENPELIDGISNWGSLIRN